MYLVRKNAQLSILKAVSLPDTALLRIYEGQPIIDRSQFNNEYGNRIPISWSSIVKDTSSIYNLQLMPGDDLVVPKDPGTVTVAGDVGLPSTVPYKSGAGLGYYIKQAGGYTATSAGGKEIVLEPNGQKWYPSGWFFIPDPKILAGSVIYVPSEIKTPGTDVWPVIRDIITVVSSTAVLILTIQRL
jgi:protein involved in polysaccharide export with SLBB domain